MNKPKICLTVFSHYFSGSSTIICNNFFAYEENYISLTYEIMEHKITLSLVLPKASLPVRTDNEVLLRDHPSTKTQEAAQIQD